MSDGAMDCFEAGLHAQVQTLMATLPDFVVPNLQDIAELVGAPRGWWSVEQGQTYGRWHYYRKHELVDAIRRTVTGGLPHDRIRRLLDYQLGSVFLESQRYARIARQSRHKAAQYAAMATKQEIDVMRVPASIPLDRPGPWYQQQAEAHEQRADTAQTMAHTLEEIHWQTAFQRLSRAEKLAVLRDHAEHKARQDRYWWRIPRNGSLPL